MGEAARAHPELLPDAVEEILRWASPISHFTRVATEDCEVRDVPIRAGDQVALYFASANRDEDVFDDPFAFRVDRRPNPHLAFGFGEHFCMGAHLARVEIETIFRHLLARLDAFELSGSVERLSSAVNGSIKHLPLRYRFGVVRDSRGDTMEQRPFGTTGLDVSAVGFGCWEVGGGYGDVEEEEFARAVARSLDLGVNCFDTAEGYGMGASERARGGARRAARRGDRRHEVRHELPRQAEPPRQQPRARRSRRSTRA